MLFGTDWGLDSDGEARVERHITFVSSLPISLAERKGYSTRAQKDYLVYELTRP